MYEVDLTFRLQFLVIWNYIYALMTTVHIDSSFETMKNKRDRLARGYELLFTETLIRYATTSFKSRADMTSKYQCSSRLHYPSGRGGKNTLTYESLLLYRSTSLTTGKKELRDVFKLSSWNYHDICKILLKKPKMSLIYQRDISKSL